MTLFVIALLMSVTAIGFVVTPLVGTQRQKSKGSANLVMLGALVVFGLGIALYAVIGRPGVQSHAASPDTTTSSNMESRGSNDKAGSIASLLDGLEARLEEDPDDGKGWLLLAQSYEVLGRVDDARLAYEKAAALGVTNDELAARLSASDKPGIPGVEIRGRVTVDTTVQDSIETDAVVYVIAKSPDNPMPLAVLRRSAGELPFDFVLSEQNSMVKGAGLAAASTLTISAKVSRTGDALADDSSLEASVQGVDPHSAQVLDIVIGKQDAP